MQAMDWINFFIFKRCDHETFYFNRTKLSLHADIVAPDRAGGGFLINEHSAS